MTSGRRKGEAAANPLVRKLANFTRLSGDDRMAVERLSADRIRQVGAREDIIREGDSPSVISLVLSGWACRYKHLEDGRRQIMSFFLPGDLCDLNVFVLRQMDHSIAAVTSARVAEITREALESLTLVHPRIGQALWWDSLVSFAIQREWTVNLGQRNAFERMAHLLCELFIRLRAVGLTEGDACAFPVTQSELADALGISSVHVNRTLQELRATNLVVLKGKTLQIPDVEGLKRAALFNANYLHLAHEGSHLDANTD